LSPTLMGSSLSLRVTFKSAVAMLSNHRYTQVFWIQGAFPKTGSLSILSSTDKYNGYAKKTDKS